jgi:hypothetical protein
MLTNSVMEYRRVDMARRTVVFIKRGNRARNEVVLDDSIIQRLQDSAAAPPDR